MSSQVPESPEQILIVKPSSLGDIVHTLPVAAALHDHWPDAHISWLVRPEFAPVLEANPAIHDTIPFPRSQFRGPSGLLRGAAWAAKLRRIRADITLDLQGLLRSALFARLGSHGIVAGMDDAREGARSFYHLTAAIDPATHSVQRYLALVEILGIPLPSPARFTLPPGQQPEAAPSSPFILFHPYARGEGKSLDRDLVEHFCQECPTPIVLVGRTEVEPPRLGQNVLNLLNQTSLPELIWLIRHAEAVISVDSGPMHIAAAVTNRLLAIHTWTDPLSVGPFNPTASVWKSGQILPVDALSDIERPPGRMPGISDLPDFFGWLQG